MAENNLNKLKPRRKNVKHVSQVEEDKSYFRWNLQTEKHLADVLREERQLGHKGYNGWKNIAYNNAANILTAQFGIGISVDNVRNHVKTWKKIYGIVSDILSHSGFSWEATTKMISVDEESVWQDYVKSHKDAKSYRWKVIENWEDIVDLCGKNRATGVGAETGEEAAQFMNLEGENDDVVDLESDTQGFDTIYANNTRSTPTTQKRKFDASSSVEVPNKKTSSTKDILAASVSKMATSFQQYIDATAKKVDPAEVYNEVEGIQDLSEEEHLKAIAWFMENEKQFDMLKAIPMEKKRSLVLMFLSRNV